MSEVAPYIASAALLLAVLGASSHCMNWSRRRWPNARVWRLSAPPKGTTAWRFGRWNWHVGMLGGAIAILTLPAWDTVPALRSFAVIPGICLLIDYAFVRRRK